MRKTLFGLLTAAVLVTAAPATAVGGSTYRGGCDFRVNTSGSIGYLDTRAVFYSETALDNPVSATVTCTLTVNGSPYWTTTESGTVVAAGWGGFAIDFSPDDVLTVCTTVDYTSNADPSDAECYDTRVDDVVNILIEYLNDNVFEPLDPTLCTALKALRPGLPPDVVIDEQGDLYVLGTKEWDCPPYGW